MRTVALMLVLAVLAGCTDEQAAPDEDPVDPGSDGNDDHGEGDSSNSGNTTSGDSANNTVPEITLAVGNASGIVPFNVDVGITASDADGDPLTWQVLLNGTEITSGEGPTGNVSIEITEAGNHTVEVIVDDGMDSSNATFEVIASADEVPVGPVVIEVITRTWKTGAGTFGGVLTYGGCSGPEDGETIATYPLDASFTGRTFTATISDDSNGAAIERWSVILNSPSCGTEVQSYSSGNAGGAVDLAGDIPDGYDFGFFTSNGGANLEATLTVYA